VWTASQTQANEYHAYQAKFRATADADTYELSTFLAFAEPDKVAGACHHQLRCNFPNNQRAWEPLLVLGTSLTAGILRL